MNIYKYLFPFILHHTIALKDISFVLGDGYIVIIGIYIYYIWIKYLQIYLISAYKCYPETLMQVYIKYGTIISLQLIATLLKMHDSPGPQLHKLSRSCSRKIYGK